MTLNNLTYYFQKKHQLIDNKNYYLRLSIAIGLVLTLFVYIFDPYDNYLAIPKFEVPIKIIQLGYGVNTACVIYFLYWLIFHKIKYPSKERPWKTYHHWLLLVFILIIAGFLGTVYHRFMMEVGEVETSYYMFVTIPRSIIISIPLFIITVLLDQLYAKNLQTKEQQHYITHTKAEISNQSIILKSPTVNQCIEIIPGNITYIKASGNYVEIYLKNEKKAKLIRASLSFVSEKLQKFDFIIKCHRQYLVNKNSIQSYKGNSQRLLLHLENTINKIPVSKSYTKIILSFLK